MSITSDKILALPGIKSLNKMQLNLGACKAPKVVLLAPTGSGKTLAFAIPVIDNLNPDNKSTVQALILAPSRELTQQIFNVIRPLALPAKSVAIYGGHSFADEEKAMHPAPQIVVATPGRLVDHLNRHTINISDVNTLVLDEYDKSLQLGFHDQMRRIVNKIHRPRRIILTSATAPEQMPDFLDMEGAKVLDFTDRTLPATINDTPETAINCYKVVSPSADKIETLLNLLHAIPLSDDSDDSDTMPRTIVFANHRESAERIFKYLEKKHIPAGLYHGGLDQRDREIALQLLANGTTPVLVSTDLGARGLDIDSVANVIHYHLPPTPDSLTHRNGRTARQGATGDIYYIVSENEKIPDYVQVHTLFTIAQHISHPVKAHNATIYFPAGKKEKLSARDILGYFAANAAEIITPAEIGKIYVADHYALAAVPRQSAQALVNTLKNKKIKNKSLRLSAMF